jgi:hypothetical protein
MFSDRLLGIAAALITMPFMEMPAWGDPCATARWSTYTEPGFSCTVGDKEFSNITITKVLEEGLTLVGFGDIVPSPSTNGGEFGLALTLSQGAGPFDPGRSGILWS